MRVFFRGVKVSRGGPRCFIFSLRMMAFSSMKQQPKSLFFKDIFREFDESSRQCVNFNKSTIFFSSNTRKGEKAQITNLIGMWFSNNLEKFLGLSNMVGRRTNESF